MGSPNEDQNAHDADVLCSTPPRSPRKWRSLAIRIGVLLAVVVLCDVFVGLLLCHDGRFIRWPLPPYDLTFAAGQPREDDEPTSPYGCFDATLGWSIRPHGVSSNGMFRANSAGFRANREYAEQTPPGVLRVAAFGDSYTHGDTVANDETWPHLLEQAIPDIEVLNFGVNGYGTDQAYLRYQRDGVRYKPQVVLIGMMVENILRNVNVYRPAYHHETPSLTVKPRFRVSTDGSLELLPNPCSTRKDLEAQVCSGQLLEVLLETDYWVARAPLAYRESPLFWSSFFRIAYAGYENWGRRPEYYYRDVTSEPFQVSLRLLAEFAAHSLRQGASDAMVLLLPDRRTATGQVDGPDRYWQTLVVGLERANVTVVDLVPLFRTAVGSEGSDAYFNGNHYNKAGNALVAHELARRLASLGENPD